MMKKIKAILLSMLMILSLAACGNSEIRSGQPSAGGTPVDKVADNDTVPENSSVDNTESANVPETQPEETGTSEVQPESGEN